MVKILSKDVLLTKCQETNKGSRNKLVNLTHKKIILFACPIQLSIQKVEDLKSWMTPQSHFKGNPFPLYTVRCTRINYNVLQEYIASPIVIRSGSHTIKRNCLLSLKLVSLSQFWIIIVTNRLVGNLQIKESLVTDCGLWNINPMTSTENSKSVYIVACRGRGVTGESLPRHWWGAGADNLVPWSGTRLYY